jgi:hypothetical protein
LVQGIFNQCCSGIRIDGPWLASLESSATTGNTYSLNSVRALVSDFMPICEGLGLLLQEKGHNC